MKFDNRESYGKWFEEQEWYQTMDLPSGLQTKGKFPTHERIPVFSRIDFKGKRVLDIGCNSGQYAFYAKTRGAREVIGIDLNEHRLQQAQTLASSENIDVTFLKRNIFELDDLGAFDIVLCVAVLTEVPDFLQAVGALKKLTASYLFLETALAKGRWIALNPKYWVRKNAGFLELKEIKGGSLVIHPSFKALCNLFGDAFECHRKGKGVRYDMIEIFRK